MKNRISGFRNLLLLALLLFGIQSFPQSVTGKWWGLLKIRNWEIRLLIQVDSASTGYKALFYSPDQVPWPTPATAFDFNFPELKLALADWDLKYEGWMDAKYQKITGTFNLSG